MAVTCPCPIGVAGCVPSQAAGRAGPPGAMPPGRARVAGLCLALCLAPAAALAQAPTPVDGLVVGGKSPAACPERAGAPDYACLNRQLQTAAKAGAPAPPAIAAAARDAQTPSKAGTFSYAATSERMGRNFGHSAQPYRPPPPAFANPITAARAPR